MFSSSVRAALAAICLSAVCVAGAPSLNLKVSGPEAADGVSNLKVTTTLTNTGDETLKLLNDPRGALSSSPTETFVISDASGTSPSFVGRRVKYVPSYVVQKNNTRSFTVLTPGQSIDIDHDLSAAYNFTSSGEGAYDIRASNLFRYIDPATQQIVDIYAEHETAHTARLSGQLSIARSTALQKRIGYNGCSSTEQSEVSAAASSANTYAANALSYLQAHTSSTTRFTTWFGTYSSSHHSTVQTHYSNMVDNDYGDYTYDCSTCDEEDTYAYVYPDEFGTIYLCPVFWEVSNTGTDSRAGTLVHESSHFVKIGSTQDYVYGQSSAKSLASSNPSEAIENADNHEYFAENNPALS